MKLGLNLSLMWRGGELVISVTIASDASGTLGTATPPAGFIFAQSAIVITIAAAGAGTEQTVDATLYPDGEIVEDTPGEFAADLILAGQTGDYTIRITGIELVPLAVSATIAGDASNPLVTLTPPTGSTWTSDTATTTNGIDVSVNTSGVLTEDSAGTWATTYILLLAGETAIDSFSADVTTNGTTFTSPVTITVTGATDYAAAFNLGTNAGYGAQSLTSGDIITAADGLTGVDFAVGVNDASIVSLVDDDYAFDAPSAGYDLGKIEDAFPTGSGSDIFEAYVSGTDFIVKAHGSSTVTITLDISSAVLSQYNEYGASIDADGATMRAVVRGQDGTTIASDTADVSALALARPRCANLLGGALVNDDEITEFTFANGIGFVAKVAFDGSGGASVVSHDDASAGNRKGMAFIKYGIAATSDLTDLMDAQLPVYGILVQDTAPTIDVDTGTVQEGSVITYTTPGTYTGGAYGNGGRGVALSVLIDGVEAASLAEGETHTVAGGTSGDSYELIELAQSWSENTVSNGTFDSDLSSWSAPGNWAWNSGVAEHTASAGYENMSQSGVVSADDYVRLTWDQTGAGFVAVWCPTIFSGSPKSNANGTFSGSSEFLSPADGAVTFRTNGAATIDNVSIWVAPSSTTGATEFSEGTGTVA